MHLPEKILNVEKICTGNKFFKFSKWINFSRLVVNIPGSASYNGETIIDYIGARPHAGTGNDIRSAIKEKSPHGRPNG